MSQQFNISGIQQLGVGIPNCLEAFKWYRQNFGMDIRVFEEAATADLMLPYTGGQPHDRHAVLAINMQGGGGFEIWQYTSRTPQPSSQELKIGDLGINAGILKTRDAKSAYKTLKSKGAELVTEVYQELNGKAAFFVKDPYGNLFKIMENDVWFSDTGAITGGPIGSILGVTNMEKSIEFYGKILGYDTITYREEGSFENLNGVPGGNETLERVGLTHSKVRKGPFAQLLGESHIELISVKSRTPHKTYEGRYWGDLGFIHLCFDITGMKALQKTCEAAGHPFTVDSANSFDMGEAAGHFSYIEDPDGSLIEFVETHKVPVLKKLGWYLNLKGRDPQKSLPKWMLKAMAFNRVKD